MNTLLLHKWEMVTEQVIYALGNVTVTSSLPAAIKEARSGKYDLIVVDADVYKDGEGALTQCAKTIGITTRHDYDMSKSNLASVIYAGVPLERFISELEEAASGDLIEWKPLRHNQMVRHGDITLGATEQEVLSHAARGLTSAQISSIMCKTRGYTDNVLRTLYDKFEVLEDGGGNRRVRLVVAAVRAGVV